MRYIRDRRPVLPYLVPFLFVLAGLASCGGDDTTPTDPGPDPGTPLPPNELPTAGFTASTESGVAPVAVTFDAGSSTDPDGTLVSYAWTFGDGGAGTGQSISHTFAAEGLFVVELTVRDDRGGEAKARDTVFVSTAAGSGANSISGTIWWDRDLNGAQDSGEPGLDKVVVFLDEDGDGERDATETMTFTGADGGYVFSGLDAGTTYTVTQELTLGWTNTTPGVPGAFQATSAHSAAMVRFSDGPARIINGEETPIEAFPFQVALLEGDFQFCGGTLINSQYVLTAAHCVDDRAPHQVEILIGTADLEAGGERVAVTAIRTHPDFSSSADHDVAVLRIERPLLRPRSFLHTPNEVSLTAPGTMATVLGWGQMENGNPATKLRRVTIPIITNALCAEITVEIYGPIGAGTLCAGGRDLGKGACFGDSGGPLLVPSPVGWTQAGVVSRNTAKDACGAVPGAYSRLSGLLDYITSVARIEESGVHVVDWSSGASARADFGNYH